MTPLVSVIIPTYNRPQLLDETLQSVRNQTMKNFEAIICDDGSTEDIEAIVAQYDKRFRILKLKHTGMPAIARNAGIISAKGQFIAFLDSDDIWLPEKLEKQLLFAKEYPQLGLISTNAYKLFESENSNALFFDDAETFHGNVLQKLLLDNFIICSSVLIKAHLIKKTGLFCEEGTVRALEDYDLWLRFATMVECGFISEPLLYYRELNADSIRSRQSLVHRANGLLYILDRYKRFCKKNGFSFPEYEYIKARRNYKKDFIRALSWKNIIKHTSIRFSVLKDTLLIRKYKK